MDVGITVGQQGKREDKEGPLLTDLSTSRNKTKHQLKKSGPIPVMHSPISHFDIYLNNKI